MAKKRRKRTLDANRPFEQDESRQPDPHLGTPTYGVYAFFRDFGVRETIESIIVAVVLALMFRAYEAEAFIIPTGSMAPTLQGQHMDVDCEQCGLQYRTGSSYDSSNYPVNERRPVTDTVCPVCRYEMQMSRRQNSRHRSFNGDRILVNKFVYDFSKPNRFDVIVFKNPNNGKQNYIKRLVGTPGDNLMIEQGDIHDMEPMPNNQWSERGIVRKPAEKLRVMLQMVDDTNYIAPALTEANWPLRWQSWSGTSNGWQPDSSGDHVKYAIDNESANSQWLNYRHLIPEKTDWRDILEKKKTPPRIQTSKGQLITDYYAYNDKRYGSLEDISHEAHWVGDLALECHVDVQSKTGTLLLDVVEGGAHYTCEIDVETGIATLKPRGGEVTFYNSDGNVQNPTAQTNLRGAGRYKIMYANADDQIFLWINNRLATFDASTFRRSDKVLPQYSSQDHGDAEPLGVGARNLKAEISRLRVLRDIYYTSVTAASPSIPIEYVMIPAPSFNGGSPIFVDRNDSLRKMKALYADPEKWGTGEGRKMLSYADDMEKHVYQLGPGQYFPMGDNSPASMDARVWPGEPYVEEEMLIGRAMFIYWPHSFNSPVPFFPNFQQMGFIK